MGREGPCLHCGIEDTPLWRPGPPGKQTLCNACGTRWRARGNLNNYIPKHGITQSSKQNSLCNDKKAIPIEENTDNDSILGSKQSSLSNCSQMGSPAAKAEVKGLPLSLKVPKRKRSVLPQYCLTSTGRLHRQLLQIQHEQQSAAKTSAASEEENDLLIYNNNWMTSSSENALGAMLLK